MPSVNPSIDWIRKAKEVLGEQVSRERPALILTVASALDAAWEHRGEMAPTDAKEIG